MARGNPLVDKEKLKEAEGRFDPNLRDEGAGFFSTLFTAGSNIGSDAVTELGYIAQAVARPIDTGEAVLRVLAGYAQKALPDDWEAYLPEDWATNKVYANAINDYYADKYGSLEQAADSFAEQPVSVALDAFAVKALLTTISKQAAKRSIATTKMANTAKGTVMEGELASRAAADLKVAQELERTVKYEGPLVWDEAIGAHVPKASVTKPAKIDAAEVAPIIDDIEAATPSVQPAVANLNTEGMMRATRNQEAFPGELAQARLAADPDLPYGEGTTINTAVPSKSAELRKVEAEINELDEVLVTGAYDLSIVEEAAIDAQVERLMTRREQLLAMPDTIDDFNVVDTLGVVSREDMIALANATKETKDAARKINEDWMDTVDNPNINSEIVYAETVIPAKIKSHEAEIAHLEAAMANTGRTGTDSAYPIAIADEQAKIAALSKDATETLAIEKAKADVEVPVAASGIDLTGTRGTDGSLLSTIPDNLMEGKLSTVARGSDDSLAAAEIAKLSRDEAAMATRRADDDIMAAATQADLFENGSAAAYEAMIASQLANRAAQTSAVATTVPKGMMAVSPETKLAKLGSVERKITDKTPVKKQEFAPVSTPKTQTETVIKPANVLPAIQRVGSAANQFTGDRDIDGSLIPIAPDKGIDIDKPKSAYIDMPPYEKSIDDRDISGGKASTKPGWFQGVSPDDDDDGNYWSADFEDEHWNTPAGVQEAIGIWGRPIGNRIGQRFN